MSELDQNLIQLVKGFEGFTPKAQWDYKQSSVGYGTRATSPGQTVTRDQAEGMLANELSKHVGAVNNFANQYGYAFGPAQQNALASFSFNLGPGVLNRVLQQAGGDTSKIPGLMNQYVNVTEADGSKHALPGLVARRNAEASLFSGGPYAALPSQTVAGTAPLSGVNTPVADLPIMPTIATQTAKATPVQIPRSQRIVSQVPNQSLKLAASLPDLFSPVNPM
jgi:lysozyme